MLQKRLHDYFGHVTHLRTVGRPLLILVIIIASIIFAIYTQSEQVFAGTTTLSPGGTLDFSTDPTDTNGADGIIDLQIFTCCGSSVGMRGQNGGGYAYASSWATASLADAQTKSYNTSAGGVAPSNGDVLYWKTGNDRFYKMQIISNTAANVNFEWEYLGQGLPPAPTPDFTFTTYDYYVVFTDASTGSVSNRSWDFGDSAGTSTFTNPRYTYNSANTYTVCLTASNVGGSNTACKSVTVSAEPSTSIAAGGSIDFDGGGVDLTIQTSGCSGINAFSVTNVGYAFQSNDYRTLVLSDATSKAHNPGSFCVSGETPLDAFTVLTSSGNYVKVWAPENEFGSGARFIFEVLGAPPPPPTTSFTIADQYDVYVRFNDTSTGTPTSWTWTFGDGNGSSSQNPSHLYPAVNTSYSACLTASNGGGSGSNVCNTVTITMEPSNSFSTGANIDLDGDTITDLTTYSACGKIAFQTAAGINYLYSVSKDYRTVVYADVDGNVTSTGGFCPETGNPFQPFAVLGSTGQYIKAWTPENTASGVRIISEILTNPPGITVTPIDSNVDEANLSDTASFTVELDSTPTAAVVISIVTDGQCTVTAPFTGNSGTISLSNMSPATITLTAVNDGVDEAASHTCNITNTVQSSADGNYSVLDPADVAISVADDDTAGVSIVEATATTMEAGTTTDTLDVVLTSEPSADVTVNISGLDTTEGSLDTTGLTFTTGNWFTPQTVTVTGVDENIDDGDITYTLTATTSSAGDATYNAGLTDTIDVTNQDDDTAGVSIVEATATTMEAGTTTDTLDVVLTSEPLADVTVNITGLDTTEGSLDTTSLTFTTGNWFTPQTVTVTGVDENIDDGDITYTLTATTSSAGDTTYNAGLTDTIDVTNQDDDGAGVSIVETTATTMEAGTTTDTFDVVLTSEPLADVTVNITGLDTTEGSLDTTSLTFTAGNWFTPQTVTVTGVNENIDDGDITYTLTATTSSAGDATYNGGLTDTIDVTNQDDDTAGVDIVETTATTQEFGPASDTFDVVLMTEPSADVTVNITGLDTTEGSLDTTSLTFTTGDWFTPQTVTVTGVDDFAADGNITYTLTATTSSAGDATYNAGLTDTIDVTNLDDENVGIIAVPSNLLVAEDAPGVNSFAVTLASPPVGSTTINITFDVSQLIVSPTSLNFDTSNWNNPQIVNVDAIADGISEDSLPYTILLDGVGGGAYDAATATVIATIFDSEALIITHVPNYGVVVIYAEDALPAAGSPSEGTAKDRSGNQIYLPADYDGNGYDTYVVTDIRNYNGQTWLALWQGTMNWLWVPYDASTMTVIQPIDWDMASDWTP